MSNIRARPGLLSSAEYHAAPRGEGVSAGAVIREVNLARQNPFLYARYIEELCSRFDGISLIFPGEAKLPIKEGMAGIKGIIAALIIDDGRPARTHRKNIFDPSFNYAGAAYGPHVLHGSVCTIDFATGYTERPA